MTNIDSQRLKEIRDNTRAMAEAFGRIADILAEALELYVSTQTETQNSNLTFEKRTIDYCDVCNHKGCDNCIADGNNPYCVPSQFESKDEPQKKEVEWVYNKRERLWYPYSNGELLFKDEPQTEREGE